MLQFLKRLFNQYTLTEISP